VVKEQIEMSEKENAAAVDPEEFISRNI